MMSEDSRTGGFDRAVVEDAKGRRELSRNEYAALPLSERIALVLQKKVRFYRGGVEVNAAQAMRG
jgi:hypothetical protein